MMRGESLIAHSFFSSRPGALFHADPHPGNLFITTDGRLGLLDWSLVGRLRKEQRIQLVDLLIGAATLDPARLQQVVEKLANGSLEKKVAEQILEGGLRELRWGTFPGVGWLTRLLDNLVLEARARFNGDLLLFRKSLLVLEGLLADLSGIDERARENFLDRALLAKLAEQLVFEWPERFRQPMEARSFQSHCSTADLLSLLCSGPAIWARYWGGAWRDLAQLF